MTQYMLTIYQPDGEQAIVVEIEEGHTAAQSARASTTGRWVIPETHVTKPREPKATPRHREGATP